MLGARAANHGSPVGLWAPGRKAAQVLRHEGELCVLAELILVDDDPRLRRLLLGRSAPVPPARRLDLLILLVHTTFMEILAA